MVFSEIAVMGKGGEEETKDREKRTWTTRGGLRKRKRVGLELLLPLVLVLGRVLLR